MLLRQEGSGSLGGHNSPLIQLLGNPLSLPKKHRRWAQSDYLFKG